VSECERESEKERELGRGCTELLSQSTRTTPLIRERERERECVCVRERQRERES